MSDAHSSVVQLNENFTLRENGEIWKPNRYERDTIGSYGFVFGETIGEGARSKVKKALCKQMNTTVAVKVIKKNRYKKETLDKFVTREISLNQTLQHPGLLDVYSVYSSSACFYIVMEYASNGDLLEFVNRLGNLSEPDARRIFKQLLDIVNYLHDNGVCHRDIKCENVLLDSYYNVKLADFGFARSFPENHMVNTKCGSYVYSAPEVLNGGQYNAIRADIWSLGICLYAMLCGRLPFRDDDFSVLRFSMQEKLKFFKYVSKDCRDLLRAILSPDPSKRPSIANIMKYSWMCKPMKSPGESSMSSMSVAAVLDGHTIPTDYDPYAEHGFTCNQRDGAFKPTRVTDVLRTVAENHSSGTSSIDLTKVAIPAKKASASAMVTGVAGPIGRRLSQQMGLNIEEPSKDQKIGGWASSIGKVGDNKGQGKEAFGKAFKALATFKKAARVVTAVKRFKRKPLNTILNMPQEQAMEKIIHTRENSDSNEIKELHYSQAGKVAALSKNERESLALSKRQSKEWRETETRAKEERLELFTTTLSVLVPETDT